jgi:hypothetical protein
MCLTQFRTQFSSSNVLAQFKLSLVQGMFLAQFRTQFSSGNVERSTVQDSVYLNNEPGLKRVWYPLEMNKTNVSGVYPSSAGEGLD